MAGGAGPAETAPASLDHELNFVGRMLKMAGRYKVILLNDSHAGLARRSSTSSKPADDAEPDGTAAVKASAKIRKLLMRLQGKFMSEDGTKIDYVGVRTSELYPDFLKEVDGLVHVNPASITTDERKAFFLNVYHVLTIHALTLYGKRVSGFYSRIAYNIGGLTYSLDDIEHGVLRNNTNHPSSNRLCFPDGDPRARCAVPLDARIHTALNCGATSCPGIHVYSDKVDVVLEESARAFLASSATVDLATATVTLPKLFKWYSMDFGENENEVLNWVESRAGGELKEKIGMVRKAPRVRIAFAKYDWGLNSMGDSVKKLRSRSPTPGTIAG